MSYQIVVRRYSYRELLATEVIAPRYHGHTDAIYQAKWLATERYPDCVTAWYQNMLLVFNVMSVDDILVATFTIDQLVGKGFKP